MENGTSNGYALRFILGTQEIDFGRKNKKVCGRELNYFGSNRFQKCS